VEDLFIEENLDDQNIDNISKPDRIKWAINSFKLIGIHIRLTINPSYSPTHNTRTVKADQQIPLSTLYYFV